VTKRLFGLLSPTAVLVRTATPAQQAVADRGRPDIVVDVLNGRRELPPEPAPDGAHANDIRDQYGGFWRRRPYRFEEDVVFEPDSDISLQMFGHDAELVLPAGSTARERYEAWIAAGHRNTTKRGGPHHHAFAAKIAISEEGFSNPGKKQLKVTHTLSVERQAKVDREMIAGRV
jgi:hypothetical protein